MCIRDSGGPWQRRVGGSPMSSLDVAPLSSGVAVLDVKDPEMRELIGKVVSKINGESVLQKEFHEVTALLSQRPIRVLFTSRDGTQDTEVHFGMGDNLGLRISQKYKGVPSPMSPPVENTLHPPDACCTQMWLCSRDGDAD
eukprot:TRINITY_DN11446_c0_g1_i1.p1 TRINITY_DN11446_c0_g1~~TRINITY_DN11446_c0_g1_i1.p1  ORF type:complete len:141 (+),score=22.95 TRINITY_DN11446_c0_g1_i1:94-516(+)